MNKADKDRLSKIASMPCIVCQNEGLGETPSEIHHIVEGKKRLGHDKTIGLCFHHHRSGVDCELYTSRHPYKSRWESRYGTEYELLDQVNAILDQ